ncbi:methyltransferase [Neptunomonas japonica]|uniref:methyltransferase n=1 Tax=Neptunomonas japonica TaxID=417574 RepID=UPI0003FAA34B|nr:methyltransferase [Neptunomonas japonica]
MKQTEQTISKAMTLLNQGKYDSAHKICKRIIARAPLHYQANLLLGVIALNTHKLSIAEKHLQLAQKNAKSKHDKAQALSNLSLSLSYQQRFLEALEYINQALNLKQQALFYCNRANIFEQLSRWSEMQKDLMIAISISPNIPEAYISLALAKRHLGDSNTALELLEQCPEYTEQDWLNEWALLSGINNRIDKVEEQLSILNLSDDAMISLGDYALEQNYPEIAQALYLLMQKKRPNHAALNHQLNALQGISSTQAPREYIESLFNSCADQFEDRLVNQLLYTLPEQMVKQLAGFLPNTAISVVDLGCGTGLLGKALSSKASISSLTGVDVSKVMLEHAGKTKLYHQLIHDDVLSNLQATKNTDLIMAGDVLIYIGELTSLFKYVSHALKDNGIFAFSVESCSTHWRLDKSGRYQHSANYIHSLLNKNNLSLEHSTICDLRLEKNQPVAGEIFILKKHG